MAVAGGGRVGRASRDILFVHFLGRQIDASRQGRKGHVRGM